ncbi:hypothetical protein SAMN05421837_106205 [Amycolatopsis pretoriensis]|uniref:Uncharacterized protein n=1 Tax=Amycolatopsis pretoriensis TaxID=218821 RepID=A0A1H5R499_9PSEU|nr:hypothetical protein [Amycolatopsis pretoriensis]SEF32391.1 hypothetical protein SAMN05421837_106205 [Amycolatopsis pretoriensis]
MGRGRRFWFPLALLGLTQIGMVAVRLLSRRSPAEGEFVNIVSLPMSQENLRATADIGRGQFFTQDPFYAPGAGLPAGPVWLVALGVVLLGTAVWYAVALRPVRTGWFVLGTIGALLAVPLLDLVGSWQFRLGDGLRGPLLATLGLLVLAAYERSKLVLLAAAGFAVIAVVLSADVVGVLGSAVVLLTAAFAVLLRPAPDSLP